MKLYDLTPTQACGRCIFWDCDSPSGALGHCFTHDIRVHFAHVCDDYSEGS